MTEVAINKSYPSFSVGDVVVETSFGSTDGVKLLKYVYVEEINEYRWVVVSGSVKENKFVPAKSSQGDVYLYLYKTSELTRSYRSKWTPDKVEEFVSGDVLKDQDGALFLVEDKNAIWNLAKGTYAPLGHWKDIEGRKFVRHSTSGGKSFSRHFTAKSV